MTIQSEMLLVNFTKRVISSSFIQRVIHEMAVLTQENISTMVASWDQVNVQLCMDPGLKNNRNQAHLLIKHA